MGMQFVGWKDSYFIGIPEIDLQHQELVVLLAKLYDAMASGSAVAVQHEILLRLWNYTRDHFAKEEALMRRCGYPELEGHLKQHAYLTSQVKLAVQRVSDGEGVMTIGLLRFIKDWLLTHIGHSDRKIGLYLQTRKAA